MIRWAGLLMSMVVGIVLWSVEVSASESGDRGPATEEQNWQIGFTPSYSTGNFGTNTTSTFFYAPLSIRRLFRDGDVTLVIPFVTATSDGRTTLVGGSPVVVQDNHGSTNR